MATAAEQTKAAEAEAKAKAEAEAKAKAEKASAGRKSATGGRYTLVANRFHQVTSKPNEPLQYKGYKRGDTVELDAEQAERLLKAGAVVKPGKDDPAKRGGQTEAPGE